MSSILASGPRCPWSISSVSKKFTQGKILSVAEVNQLSCLEESGQWLENVDLTHLVVASGKLVLQKINKKDSAMLK